MTDLKPCPGRRKVTDHRTWYTPVGKTSRECTICEDCFFKYSLKRNEYTTNNNLYECNCDYPKDYTKTSLTKDGIRVSIVDVVTNQAYNRLEVSDAALVNGVMHVGLPTTAQYMILIENDSSNSDTYFTIENGSVGDKRILINGGRTIYYGNSTEIMGFETGSNQSFMFQSLSSQEKSEGSTLSGENVTNIISLKIRKWKVEVKPRSMSRGYGELRSRGGDRGTAKGSGDDFYQACSDDYESMGVNSRIAESVSWTGGATVYGGSHVHDVKTTSTSDKFIPVGEVIEFLIQLVCTQTDLEKYAANRRYKMTKDHAARKILLEKQASSQKSIDSHRQMMESYQSEIRRIENELTQYAYLGSIEDHLIKF